jgi:hypothetical protein
MFVPCVCCVLCREWLMRRADHSFRGVLPVVCVCVCLIVCDLETSTVRRPRPELGRWATEKNLLVLCRYASDSIQSSY